MKSFFSVHRLCAKAYGVMAVASLLFALCSSVIAFAQSKAPTSVEPSVVDASSQQATKKPIALSREEQQKREEWHKAMSQIPLPKKGCFKATYPIRKWQELPCTSWPPHAHVRDSDRRASIGFCYKMYA